MPYVDNLVGQFWSYRQQAFAGHDHLFDRQARTGLRPPVFLKSAETHNVLVDPQLDLPARNRILSTIPPWKRHRWFRSMKSSQALVQCVFGTLKTLGMLHILADVVSEENNRSFDFGGGEPDAELEKSVKTLGELAGHTTEVDLLLSLDRRVAVECKLAEQDVGTCSRTNPKTATRFHCDGSYTHQHGRTARCSLTEAGISYWRFIPHLFRWDGTGVIVECPLRHTYQIVRNVLAACVRDGEVDANSGVAVLVYDERNPAFAKGKGFHAYQAMRHALLKPHCLCRVKWQSILAEMRKHQELNWLTGQVKLKYGL
jgi:hypothetical protein